MKPSQTRLPRWLLPSLLIAVSVVGLALILWTAVKSRERNIVRPHSYQFAGGHEAEWQAFGGKWFFHDNIVESKHSVDRGAKLLSGSDLWGNYTLTADLKFDSERGDMGVIVRSQDEQVGIDAYNGYYVGLRMDGGTLIIGRTNYGWVEARPVPLAGGVRPSEWYRMRVTAYNCNLAASIQNLATLQTAWVAFEERNCARNGRIGLRSVDVEGAWRNISIEPATMSDYLKLQHHTDSVERPVVLSGPPWWTPWHIGELFVGALALASLVQLFFYRFQRWKMDTITQERQKLAHDIHDTMAQNFAGLGYHVQGIRSALIRGGLQEPQQIADQLGVAYQLIRRCHTEASETIAMLGSGSSSSQEKLEKILAESAEKLAGHGIVVTSETQGAVYPLNLRVRDALQHIGKEAIANAITHSGLTRLSIMIHYQPRRVELLIKDDGKGFTCGPQTQGFGISGMQKRARDVRGTLHISSKPGTGTEVHAIVGLHLPRWKEKLSAKVRHHLLVMVSDSTPH